MDNAIDPDGIAHTAPIVDIVITRLSPAAFCLRIAVVMAILIGCWDWGLFPHGAAAKDVFESRVFLIVALVSTPIAFWSEWTMLRQMILQGGRAVWIEGGQLKFIDDTGFGRRFRSIPVADIQELSVQYVNVTGKFPRFRCVAIKTKDGWVSAYITTLFFADGADVVRARLAEALSLPKTA